MPETFATTVGDQDHRQLHAAGEPARPEVKRVERALRRIDRDDDLGGRPRAGQRHRRSRLSLVGVAMTLVRARSDRSPAVTDGPSCACELPCRFGSPACRGYTSCQAQRAPRRPAPPQRGLRSSRGHHRRNRTGATDRRRGPRPSVRRRDADRGAQGAPASRALARARHPSSGAWVTPGMTAADNLRARRRGGRMREV
jgi:hypothetical protein